MRITPEIVEQINELYYNLKVKKKVAEIIGCSSATVSKYIQYDYIPKSKRSIQTFSIPIGTSDYLIPLISGAAAPALCRICLLSEEEKADLIELQKEIYI